MAVISFSGCIAQRRISQLQDINIEQLLLQADPVSIERLLNEAVEESDAKATVSVQQSNSVEISEAKPKKPRLFRPSALRNRLRQRPRIEITAIEGAQPLVATTTEVPSARRASLFSPRRRLQLRTKSANKEKEAKEQPTTQTTPAQNNPRRFKGFIRQQRPRPTFLSRATARTTTTVTTTTATTTTTTTTTTEAPIVDNLGLVAEYDDDYEDGQIEEEVVDFFQPTVTFGPSLPPTTTPRTIVIPTFAPIFDFQPAPSRRVRPRINKNRLRQPLINAIQPEPLVNAIPIQLSPQRIERPRSSLNGDRRRFGNRERQGARQRQQIQLSEIEQPQQQRPNFEPLLVNPTASFHEDIHFAQAQADNEPDYEDIEEPATRAPPPRRLPIGVPNTFVVSQQHTQNNLQDGDRVKVLDRYSSRNEDGSFTWGYQSADGSFKEETIGVDCITRGR